MWRSLVMLAALILFLAFSDAAAVLAEDYGLSETGAKIGYVTGEKGDTVISMTVKVINIGLALVGIVFFVLVVYAGLRWMAAQGKEEHVETAKKTLEAAIIGIIIVVAAYAITSFVFSKVGSLGGIAPTTGGAEVPSTPLPSPATGGGGIGGNGGGCGGTNINPANCTGVNCVSLLPPNAINYCVSQAISNTCDAAKSKPNNSSGLTGENALLDCLNKSGVGY